MKGNKKNLAQRDVKRKRIELIIGGIGYLIGIGLGVWVIIKMVLLNISK